MTELIRVAIREHLDALEARWRREEAEREERRRKKLMPRDFIAPKGLGLDAEKPEERAAAYELDVLWKKMIVFIDAGLNLKDREERAETAVEFIIEICDTAEQADALSSKIRLYATRGPL